MKIVLALWRENLGGTHRDDLRRDSRGERERRYDVRRIFDRWDEEFLTHDSPLPSA